MPVTLAEAANNATDDVDVAVINEFRTNQLLDLLTFDDDALRAAGRVSITGPYASHEAADLVRASRSDVALFLSVWPETWCYALTEAWAAGLPAFGFDIGAIGERIAATGLGAVFPLGWQACEINDFLLETARRMRGPSAFCRK